MKVFKTIEECSITNPVITVGTFDGVHKGHQEILKKLLEVSREKGLPNMVITFWPHPRYVLNKDIRTFFLLNTLEEKLELFEKSGVENVLLIEFTPEFAQLTPYQFIDRYLIEGIHAREVVIGYDHRFGRNREGSISYLMQKTYSNVFSVYQVPPFLMGYLSVSSTKIRHTLSEGKVFQASQMLGYPYYLKGEVIKGMGLGHSLEFPTANIRLLHKEKQVPGDGVYVCRVDIRNDSYYGMLNIGNNPTVPQKGRSVEVHLFDFNETIYHEVITIHFLKRIRDEMKFNSMDELKEQMKKDKEFALQLIRKY